MYQYATTDSTLIDGVSDIYLVSIATALLAVIIAFYLLKSEHEKHDEEMEEIEEEYDYIQNETILCDDSDQVKQELQKRLIHDFEECNSDSDCKHCENTDDEDEVLEEHVDGLVSKLKSKRAKELEARLTQEQIEEEKRIEREQLAAIFELLKRQEAELNMKEIDEGELNAQLNLYR